MIFASQSYYATSLLSQNETAHVQQSLSTKNRPTPPNKDTQTNQTLIQTPSSPFNKQTVNTKKKKRTPHPKTNKQYVYVCGVEKMVSREEYNAYAGQ